MFDPRHVSAFKRLSTLVLVSVTFLACGSSSAGLEATRSENAAQATEPTEPDPATTETVDTAVAPTSPQETDPPATDPPETDPPETDPPETDPPETDPPAVDPTEMMDLPGTQIPLDGPFPYDPNKPAQEFDGLMVATIEDLVQWWTDEMPRVFGQEYIPLEGGVFPAYPDREDYPSPGCFDSYEEIAGNGFYCPRGDYIVWDDANYALPNYEDHGSGAITGLMSHEWGHAIQARTGVFDIVPELTTVIVELQADCYSGAWFAHIARGESDLINFSDADIRSGLIDVVLSADPVGTSPDDDGAHGAGFDRVAAFQEGFDLGAETCAGYPDSPPPITEFGFTEEELSEDEDPGDLTYDELVELFPVDLNFFWQSVVPDFTPLTLQPFDGGAPACGSVNMEINTNPLALFCPDNSTVYMDQVSTQAALEQYGDFAPAYLLATAWADAAQLLTGSTLSGEPRVLFNDCLAGVWAASLPTQFVEGEERALAISPGDLDEAVATVILLADDTADEDLRGDSFVKVQAFRTGVLSGTEACQATFGG